MLRLRYYDNANANDDVSRVLHARACDTCVRVTHEHAPSHVPIDPPTKAFPNPRDPTLYSAPAVLGAANHALAHALSAAAAPV